MVSKTLVELYNEPQEPLEDTLESLSLRERISNRYHIDIAFTWKKFTWTAIEDHWNLRSLEFQQPLKKPQESLEDNSQPYEEAWFKPI